MSNNKDGELINPPVVGQGIVTNGDMFYYKEMSNERAINTLKDFQATLKYLCESVDNDAYKAYETAIKAMEKQIAKKPIGISWTHEGRVGNCPSCKKLVHELYDINGCSECLQRLKWGGK